MWEYKIEGMRLESYRGNNYSVLHKALGYRAKLYKSLERLNSVIDWKNYFVFKGGALLTEAYHRHQVLREFGDIDIFVIDKQDYEKLLKSEIYNIQNNKFEHHYWDHDLKMKTTYDIKVGSSIEGIPVSEIINRLKIVQFNGLKIQIPSYEDQCVITLAHNKKHISKGDVRKHFQTDMFILLKEIKNKMYLETLLKKYELWNEFCYFVENGDIYEKNI